MIDFKKPKQILSKKIAQRNFIFEAPGMDSKPYTPENTAERHRGGRLGIPHHPPGARS